MRYKTLVKKKLDELKYYINAQSSFVSMLRPQEELKAQLEKMLDKIQEIDVLLNTEEETF